MLKRSPAAASFVTIFAATRQHLRRSGFVLLGGVILYALLMDGVSQVVGEQIATRDAALWHSIGRDPVQTEELLRRAREGDEVAFNELIQQQDAFLQQLEQLPEAERNDLVAAQSVQVLTKLLPFIALMLIVQLLVMLSAFQYYLIQAMTGASTFGALWMRLRPHFWPLLGLSLWIVLRSFSWLPFIGPLLALLLWPRFAAAPVLLLKEKKGVFQSARLSYERTREQWWSLVGNAALMSIIVAVGMFIIFALLRQASFLPPFLLGLLVAATWQAGLLLLTVFTAKLGLSVLGLPLTPLRE